MSQQPKDACRNRETVTLAERTTAKGGRDVGRHWTDGPPVVPGYRIGRQIGRGSSGVVYEAFDEVLGRQIALKVLVKPDPGDSSRSALDEARVMAQLSHPNVVQVYGVGTTKGREFIAMEFVQGVTLWEWQKTTSLGWREILEIYVRGAKGLSAAHKSGIVHRDFKPGNVLLGDDGSVKVADFGLANAAAIVESRQSAMGSTDPSDEEVSVIAGTPAYMAPEQLMGLPSRPAADQFAFCVSLFEALHGYRPFAGDPRERLRQLQSDVPYSFSKPRPDLPAALKSVLSRGLERDPHARWSDMDELVQELSRLLAGSRVSWVAFVAPIVVSGLGLSFAFGQLSPDAGCKPWERSELAGLERALSKTRSPTTEEEEARVLDELAAWDDRSEEAWSDVCDTGEISAAELEIRQACFTAVQREHHETIRLLSSFDRIARPDAVETVLSLPAGAQCRDLSPAQLQQHRQSMPDSPAARALAHRVYGLLPTIDSMLGTGQFKLARDAVEQELALARELEHPPIIAALQLRLGIANTTLGDYDAAQKALRASYDVAVEAGAQPTALKAAIKMASLLGAHEDRAAEGMVWLDAASPYLRTAASPAIEWDFLTTRASMLRAQHNFSGAEEAYRRAIATVSIAPGDWLRQAESKLALGVLMHDQGEFHRAAQLNAEALSIYEQRFGRSHPRVAHAKSALGTVMHSLEEDLRAVRLHREALSIRERTSGERSSDVVESLINLAVALSALGHVEEAREADERALAIEVELGGRQSETYASILGNLGILDFEAGDLKAALRRFEQVHEIYASQEDGDHPGLGWSLELVGGVHFELGQLELAEGALREAVSLRERELGKDHPVVANVLFNLCVALIARESWEEARQVAERLLRIRVEEFGPEHRLVGDALAMLAKAMYELGGTDEVVEHTETAVRILSGLGEDEEELTDLRLLLADAKKRVRKNRSPLDEGARAAAVSGATKHAVARPRSAAQAP